MRIKGIQTFQVKKCLKHDSYDYLSLITIDSAIRLNKKYQPETLFGECKFEIRKNKRYNFINEDLEPGTESDNDESVNESESD